MDIFSSKIKDTENLYKKIQTFLAEIPEFKEKKLFDIINNINQNFVRLEKNKKDDEIVYIFNIWNLINENLYLINSIVINLDYVSGKFERELSDGVSERDIDKIYEIYSNINSVLKKYQKENVERDIKILNDSIEFIKLKLSWTKENTKDNVKKITSIIKEYPHAISLYTYLLQNVINECISSTGICDFIINEIENVKNDIILYNEKVQNGRKSLFHSNPTLKTFGLTPSDDASELKVITEKIFGFSVNTLSGLSALSKKENVCIVVLNHIIKNPIEFNIWKLIDKNVAQSFLQNPDMGITKKSVERFNTIKYQPLEKGKTWNFDIDYYGSIDSSYFVILANMNYKLYRTYSIYDEMPIVGGGKRVIKIPRYKIESFIAYVKNGGIMKTVTRVSQYHKIQEQTIMKNIFLPVKFNVLEIKSESQIIDSKFLRYEIFLRMVEQINQIITKDFKNGSKIKNFKDIGTIAHSPKLVDVFNSILVEQYDIYAIKNREHSSKFPFSETFQTFLSVLNDMNTDFRRLIHDYYVRTKIEERLLTEDDTIKAAGIIEIFKDILNNVLQKIINNERNIYQELIFKNSLLKLSLV